MEEQDGHTLLFTGPESMSSVAIGGVMSTLLSTRSKKLQDSISRLSLDARKASLESVDESLRFLYNYAIDAVEKGASVEEILVPMITHKLRSKELKHATQSLILLNWLFRDQSIFDAAANSFTNIISNKDDRYISLGWCVLVRDLLEYENIVVEYTLSGIKDKYTEFLGRLCSCIHPLVSLVRNQSILQDGYELPSRLSMSAADCLLSLTEALTKETATATTEPKLKSLNQSNQPASLVLPRGTDTKKGKLGSGLGTVKMELKYALWHHLEELIHLVETLFTWNKKSRPLHARGLEQVLKWLCEIKGTYSSPSDEAPGALLLSSCWKHYGMLLHLEDQKFTRNSLHWMEHYKSGIQYYTRHCAGENANDKKTSLETNKFFLNCICLLLGRLSGRKLNSIISEDMQLVQYLLLQLGADAEDLVVVVVSILKSVLFGPLSSSESNYVDSRQMEVMIPSLLHLLDEKDGTAKAVVMLIAEYCCRSKDDHCLKEVLKRFDSESFLSRKNAVDVMAEIIRQSNDSLAPPSNLACYPCEEVASCLLKCLGDEEAVVRERASDTLKLLEPSMVLPGLVNLVFHLDDKVQSSAANALLDMIKFHKEDPSVICMLLDCLSNIQGMHTPKATGLCGQGSKFDVDRVLAMIPEWSKHVKNWNPLIELVVRKMFAEPANAIIVRFLSYINEHLADSADVVLSLVLSYMRDQKVIEKNSLSTLENGNTKEAKDVEKFLFERLCPLLILRLLPLKVFSDLNSSIMYGQLRTIEPGMHEWAFNISDSKCLAAFLLKRAFSDFEFEDVRKLSAELCGRFHPQVLYPVVCFQLEKFAGYENATMAKSCLFSLCTSFVIRRWELSFCPTLLMIRKSFERILLWPSSDGDQISKAQLGCIDCLAFMICSELQASRSLQSLCEKEYHASERNENSCVPRSRNMTLAYVLEHLTQGSEQLNCPSKLNNCQLAQTSFPLSFRVCMANVLISACQKVTDPGKKLYARKTIPTVVQCIEATAQPEVRAACIQFLFTAVYHLKSAVLPYTSALFKLSLMVLEQGSEKERLAGTRLMTSLMASEDVIVASLLGGLVEARLLLSRLSLTDSSANVREVCKKLLRCVTDHGDDENAVS